MTLGTITPLRRLCMTRGMSRRQVALKAGLTPQTLYSMETGQIPSGKTITKLAEALEITPAELVDALFSDEKAAA